MKVVNLKIIRAKMDNSPFYLRTGQISPFQNIFRANVGIATKRRNVESEDSKKSVFSPSMDIMRYIMRIIQEYNAAHKEMHRDRSKSCYQ